MAGADTRNDDDSLEDAKEAFDLATEAWADNYNEALDDFRFARLHEHWPPSIRKERELEGRPCLTIPKLPSFIRQVVNDARQNKPGIITQPVDGKGDPETAEIINGLIRHIERASHADVAYDTAIDHAVTGGFGWFKINTRYCDDDGFEQDICIDAVQNCFSILPDPEGMGATSLDWNSAFEVVSVSKKAFEKRFKGADAVSFQGRGNDRKPVTGGEDVQYVVHWSREESTREIVALTPPDLDADEGLVAQALPLLGERMIVDLSVYEKNKDLFDALGVGILGQPRAVPSHKVTQRLLSGAEVLKTVEWAGRYIPIIPVYGTDINIEGKRYLEGLIRPAKDEQRRYNFELSAATEASGLAPKAPWVGPAGSFVTDAEKWNSANVKNHPYLEYDVVPNAASGPQRQGIGSEVPVGKMQLALSASDNMKAILGLYDASLGQRSNETSGRAINARKAEGDTSTFHYIDNLSRAIRNAGEVILDLIPHVYSTPRVVRILGPDERDPKPVQINQKFTEQKRVQGPDGQDRLEDIERIYDLTTGKYDLSVKAGPSFSTQREEFVALATEIIRSYPAAAPVLADLIVRNYDIPDADEIVKRLEAMLPAQLQGENPEAQALKAQLQKLAELLGQTRAQLQAAEADRSLDSRKLDIEATNAETNRMKAIAPKGVPYDPAQMMPVVMASLAHILNSPDILEAAANGVPPEQIMAALAGGNRQPPGAPPPAAAAGDEPPRQPPMAA